MHIMIKCIQKTIYIYTYHDHKIPMHLTKYSHNIVLSMTTKYRIRTNIGGYNIWRFVEIMDLARY